MSIDGFRVWGGCADSFPRCILSVGILKGVCCTQLHPNAKTLLNNPAATGVDPPRKPNDRNTNTNKT